MKADRRVRFAALRVRGTMAVRVFSGEPQIAIVGGTDDVRSEFEEFAKVVAKLIQTNAEVRQAIRHYACQFPNLVVEY